MHRSAAVVCSILLDLQSSILRKKPYLKKIGKILKICALVKVI
jgi:hypothetical protein